MFDGFYDMTVAICWGFLAAARRAMIIQKKSGPAQKVS
jgi:hypothetical protein